MRTTITLDDKLVEDLRADTGIAEVSALVRVAMIERQQRLNARAIIAMGGSDPNAWAPNEGEEPRFDYRRHLLPGSRVWTRDNRLLRQAERLGVAYIAW